MKIDELRDLLKDKRVIEEINRHLWLESQKAGYSIGIERATDEWLKLYAEGWMKYHLPEKYSAVQAKKRKGQIRSKRDEKIKKAVSRSKK
jgi:tRNA A58 N-methylase Trm61